MAALTAAFELTDGPGRDGRYDITVYQLGWRLGGKGASGRNPQMHDRIEEHGLHVWGGFYENAFTLMQHCYKELGRPAGSPLATWRDAFKPHNFVVLEEYVNGAWKRWSQDLVNTDSVPGDGTMLNSPWDYIRMLVEWMLSAINESPHAVAAANASRSRFLPDWVERRLLVVGQHLEHTFLNLAHHLILMIGPDPNTHPAGSHRTILWLIREFMDWFYRLIAPEIGKNDVTRRLWILLNFSAAAVTGVLEDGLLVQGVDSIDHLDFAEWLRKHGATDLTLDSAIMHGYYDYFFAYEDGDPDKPRLAAGAALMHLFRLTLTYKTSIFWEMQAGMGDAVFAPLYLVLKKRGVKFKFFHRVEGLELSADKKSIGRIRLGQQVDLNVPEYDPLVDVKGLPCWPSNPCYEQIVQGPELQQRGIDLESPWSCWQNVKPITLSLGQDFDKVVLGITLAALRPICPEVIAASPAWKNMFDNLKTVPTVGVQVWLGPDANGLGWNDPPPVLTSYAHPMDSAADFTHLLGRENWPAGAMPQTLWYFCGAMPGAATIPDPSAQGYPAEQKDRVKKMAIQWLQDNSTRLWPEAAIPGDPSSLNWDALFDEKGGAGVARFDAQYWRANVNPGERYVLTLPGDNRFRLRPGQSGFDNLYLAGDWVYTGLGGCIEGAAMAGMMASRALAGYPEKIFGEVVGGLWEAG